MKKVEANQPIPDDNEDHFPDYYGQRKPAMPRVPLESLSLDFQMHQDVSQRRAYVNDFVFFHDILSCEQCPAFNGYNTTLSREQGHALIPKT